MKHIKLLFILFSITCLSNLNCSEVINSYHTVSSSSNLAYRTTGSTTYTKHFITDNSITGTGNKLKDVTYNTLCSTLKCTTGCCEGVLNTMYCGIAENCVKYQDYKRLVTFLVAFFVPWGILLLASIWGLIYCDNSCSNFFIIILMIVLLPLSPIICFCWCKGKSSDNRPSPQNKEVELDIKGVVDKNEEIDNIDIQNINEKINNEISSNAMHNNLFMKNEVDILDQPYSNININGQGQMENNIIYINNNNNNNQMFESGNYPAINDVNTQKEDNAAPLG